jgi:hypothetical protein
MQRSYLRAIKQQIEWAKTIVDDLNIEDGEVSFVELIDTLAVHGLQLAPVQAMANTWNLSSAAYMYTQDREMALAWLEMHQDDKKVAIMKGLV